jgi:hypothetical protein
MKDSVQQVHSKPCSHSTGVRGLCSIAWAICGTTAGDKPKDVAVSEQYFIKLRREIPLRRMTS